MIIKKGIILLMCSAMIFVNYKLFHSTTWQGYLMYDYNSHAFNLPFDLAVKVNNKFPNVTLTTLPIKFLQARYYREIDSIDIAKKMYHESRAKNINPYLKAAEGELADIYLNEEQYDSAYYYSKIAFENIPNSNPHRHAYFRSLAHRKDTIELRRSFDIIKEFDNSSHWKEYFMRRYEIVGANDNEIMELIKDYRVKFNLENDQATDVMESVLTSGSQNVVISVELSLKGDELFAEEKYLESARLYELASDFDSTDYIFYENAAIANNLGGNYEKAKFYFNKVINDFKPMNGKSEFYYGIMLIKLEDIKGGCENLKKAVDLKFSGQGSIDVYNYHCN